MEPNTIKAHQWVNKLKFALDNEEGERVSFLLKTHKTIDWSRAPGHLVGRRDDLMNLIQAILMEDYFKNVQTNNH